MEFFFIYILVPKLDLGFGRTLPLTLLYSNQCSGRAVGVFGLTFNFLLKICLSILWGSRLYPLTLPWIFLTLKFCSCNYYHLLLCSFINVTHIQVLHKMIKWQITDSRVNFSHLPLSKFFFYK